jgi:acetyl-CoA hydrolase
MREDIMVRIRNRELREKVLDAEDCIRFFKNGQCLGWSGFTTVGYPKAIPIALAEFVEKNSLQGKLKFNLFVGASAGTETEDRWARNDMIDRRWPYASGPALRKGVNDGTIRMGDKHLSMFAQDLKYGFYTKEICGRLDIAIIEASAIDENGNIILSGAVGAAPEIIDIADRVIVEINTALPSFEGMHDILPTDLPPARRVIPITNVRQRVGSAYVPVDKSKIVAIVESRHKDNGASLPETDPISSTIAGHIIDFFGQEVKAGRLPENLLPLQSGVGGIANAVVAGLVFSPFEKLTVFTEVLQDSFLPFIDSGKCEYVNCTSLTLSNKGFAQWWENFDFYKEKVLLRPQQISNNPEVIRRLGVIAMNTPVEFDIYGHANSTHVGGTKMLNGIGGSGDFERNAYLSIMHCPSVRGTATDPLGISGVVPKVPHCDHTEHDLDVLVTEQGLADLRGLSPWDRARTIIDQCAHPDYRNYLHDYLDRAISVTGGHHQPHLIKECYKIYESLEENGTMRFWL